MAFFRGDLDGKGAHDDLAKEIAMAGKQWTAEHWRWQDMQVCESILPQVDSALSEVFDGGTAASQLAPSRTRR